MWDGTLVVEVPTEEQGVPASHGLPSPEHQYWEEGSLQ